MHWPLDGANGQKNVDRLPLALYKHSLTVVLSNTQPNFFINIIQLISHTQGCFSVARGTVDKIKGRQPVACVTAIY
jgi:hypothetical protein